MKRHLFVAVVAIAACGGPAPDAPLEQVTIAPGASLRAISESLASHHILEHPKWFRTLARIKGVDRSAQAGIYELRHGERASEVLRILIEGRGKLVRFTVPEGEPLRSIADLAEEATGHLGGQLPRRDERHGTPEGCRCGGNIVRGVAAPGDLPGAGDDRAGRPRGPHGTGGRITLDPREGGEA